MKDSVRVQKHSKHNVVFEVMIFRLFFILHTVAEIILYFLKCSKLKNDSWTIQSFLYLFNKSIIFCRLFTAP